MKLAKFAFSILLFGMSLPAFSAPVTFLLGDHAAADLYDGSNSGPNGPYGLRLDFIAPSGDGPTYSVGSNLGGSGGVLTLTWDDADLSLGATISGDLYRNDLGIAASVSYTLTGLLTDGLGGWTATAGSGTLTEFDGGPTITNLTGEQDNDGFAFIFANDGDRLPTSDGWVGRGWLQGAGINDFLVTATVVPVPASVWLFGSALGLLGWLRRKPAV